LFIFVFFMAFNFRVSVFRSSQMCGDSNQTCGIIHTVEFVIPDNNNLATLVLVRGRRKVFFSLFLSFSLLDISFKLFSPLFVNEREGLVHSTTGGGLFTGPHETCPRVALVVAQFIARLATPVVLTLYGVFFRPQSVLLGRHSDFYIHMPS